MEIYIKNGNFYAAANKSSEHNKWICVVVYREEDPSGILKPFTQELQRFGMHLKHSKNEVEMFLNNMLTGLLEKIQTEGATND